jgi:two-component system nitrogen regulation response regulator GlnG
MSAEKILIAEDEDSLRFALAELLKAKGHEVVSVADGKEAMEAVADLTLEVALIDIKLPRVDGLEILKHSRKLNPGLRPIIMTAHTTLDNAVAAMKSGAFDYLAKPFEIAEVEEVVARALSAKSIYRQLNALREELEEKDDQEIKLVGESRVMVDLYKTIGRISKTDATVLLQGESGTGKELIARIIHRHSLRLGKPFRALNLAALPRELLEAELFGHEKGAFTGALGARKGKLAEAQAGTLFLDEIGDMPLDLQAKLLRVIEQREFEPLGSNQPHKLNVRIIAASNQDLARMAAQRRFRADLFYRINVITLKLPSLRERKGDVPLLVEHFCHKYQHEAAERKYFTPAAMEVLLAHSWPGNVRELENTVRRALILSSAAAVGAKDISLAMGNKQALEPEEGSDLEALLESRLAKLLERLGTVSMSGLYELVLKSVERPLFKLVLDSTKGNKVKAAEILGMNRNTLAKKLASLGIGGRSSKRGG